MFDTLKKIRYLQSIDYKAEKIRQLEKELADKNAALDSLARVLRVEQQKNALLDASPLPKCKSLACARCEHVVYQDIAGRVFILGCGKGKAAECADFAPAAKDKDTLDRLYSAICSGDGSGDKLTD